MRTTHPRRVICAGILDRVASSPTLHRLSPEIYDRMVESGLLDGEPVELVDGLLVHVSPQGPEHAALVQWLTVQFAGRAELLRVQLPMMTPAGRPEPDVALAESVSARRHPDTAFLVVEVAVTSWDDDVAKLPGYAAAGVGVAWLIDVPGREVHLHRQPTDAGFASSQVLRAGDVLPAPVAGVPDVAVSDLFAVLDR
jgi:Uma2 family endonuclease